jgi:hypothetical protein
VAPGVHLIRLDRAELVGNWVPPETFRLGLVGLWMFSLLGYLVWESWEVHGRLRRSMKRSRALEKMALRDPLTRVANRDGMNRALELLMQVQGEMSFPLSVVFVDADHFKRVNDEHGHDVGDQVLVLAVDGDAGRGVVIGGLYGAGGWPDNGIESDAVRRFTLKTPGGQRVLLDDHGELMRLENKHGSFIELAPGRMKVHAEGTGLTLEAPGHPLVIRAKSVDFEEA